MVKTLIILITLIRIQGVQGPSYLDYLDPVGRPSLPDYLCEERCAAASTYQHAARNNKLFFN